LLANSYISQKYQGPLRVCLSCFSEHSEIQLVTNESTVTQARRLDGSQVIWEIGISQGSGVGLKVHTVRNKKSVFGGSVKFCCPCLKPFMALKGHLEQSLYTFNLLQEFITARGSFPGR